MQKNRPGRKKQEASTLKPRQTQVAIRSLGELQSDSEVGGGGWPESSVFVTHQLQKKVCSAPQNPLKLKRRRGNEASV